MGGVEMIIDDDRRCIAITNSRRKHASTFRLDHGLRGKGDWIWHHTCLWHETHIRATRISMQCCEQDTARVTDWRCISCQNAFANIRHFGFQWLQFSIGRRINVRILRQSSCSCMQRFM